MQINIKTMSWDFTLFHCFSFLMYYCIYVHMALHSHPHPAPSSPTPTISALRWKTFSIHARNENCLSTSVNWPHTYTPLPWKQSTCYTSGLNNLLSCIMYVKTCIGGRGIYLMVGGPLLLAWEVNEWTLSGPMGRK